MRRGSSYLIDEIAKLFTKTHAHHREGIIALVSMLIGTLRADRWPKANAIEYFTAAWDEMEKLSKAKDNRK